MVAVISIIEPKGRYYGGEVAAPVFSNIMAGALRLRNVNPDGQQVYSPQANSSHAVSSQAISSQAISSQADRGANDQ